MTDIDDIIRELGVSPSGVYSDVRARLDVIESRINNPLVPSPTVNDPFTIGTSAVTIRTGTGDPTQSDVDGSLYLRKDGYGEVGLYVRRGGIWKLISTDNSILSVKLFGAIGNGIADDTAAIQAAINFVNAAGGGILKFEAGIYKCSSVIKILDKVNVVGDGQESTTITFSGASAGNFPDGYCIGAIGSLTEIQTIASPVTANAQSITLTGAPSLSPNDIVIIYNSTDGSFSNGRPYYRAGEYARVLSVSSNTVNFFDKLYGTYSVGSNIHIYKLNSIKMSIKGLTLIGQGTSTLSTLRLDMTSDSSISYLHATNTNYANIDIRRSYNILVDHIKVEDTTAAVGLNYGIILANAQKIIVTNSMLVTSRHGLANGGGDFIGAVPTREVLISNCIIGNNGLGLVNGLDWHGNCENMTVDHCFLPKGIVFGGDRARITNCIIFPGSNAGEAIHASELLGFDIVIQNNTIYSNTAIDASYGLVNIGYPGQTYLTRTRGLLRISNNKIIQKTSVGITIYVYNLDMPTNDLDIDISNNDINCEDTSGSSFIDIRSVDGYGFKNIVLADNTLRGIGILIDGGNPETVHVKNNTISGSTYFGIGIQNTTTTSISKQYIKVHGNFVEKSKFTGMLVYGQSQSFSILDIKNNFVVNSSLTSLSNPNLDSSIFVNNALLAIMQDNVIGDNQSIPTQTSLYSTLNLTTFIEDNNINMGTVTTVTTSGVTKELKKYTDHGLLKDAFGTAAPVTGTWVIGDKVWNRTPTSGGNIGWVCITGGTPGTWRIFGLVSSSTGANLIVDTLQANTSISLTAGNVATTGHIRASNNTTILAARNAANSANISLLTTDSSNNITLGDGTNSVATTIYSGSVTQFIVGSTTTFSTGTTYVQSFVPNFVFNSAVAGPNIAHGAIVANGGTGQTLTIRAQDVSGTGTTTGGALDLQSGSGGTISGNVYLRTGNTVRLTVSPSLISTTLPFVLAGANQATTGDIRASNNTTILAARNTANSANITVLKTDASDQITIGDTTNTAGVFLTANSSTGTIRFHGTTIIGDPDTTARISITPGATTTVAVAAAVTSFIFSQTTKTSDTAPVNFIIRPQAPFSTATGTNRTPASLVADVAVPTNSGTGEGRLTVTRAGIFSAAMGPYESAGSIFSAAYLGPNMTPSGTNFSFLGNGVDISYLNVPTGGTIYLSFQGSGATAGSIGLTSTSLAFSTLSTPIITQLDKTTNSGTGATFTVQAQNETGTTSIGGKLALTSGTGTTIAGNIELQTGGTARVTISPTTVTSTLPVVAPGIINTISYVVGTSATTDSTRSLPADGYVTSIQIKILTPYSVGGTISVGQSGSVSLFAATTDINPQGSAGDIYAVEQWTQAASAAAVRVTVGGSPAAGQCVVIIKYTQPSA